MNAGLPLHFFPITHKEKYKRLYFSVSDNTTKGMKVKGFEHTDSMICCSIQNVVFNEMKGRKIKDDAN